jgi:perosamine synthetase
VNPRHRLDVLTRDLLYAVLACVLAGSRRRRAAALAEGWSSAGIVCRSLRSAFDLLLAAVAPPSGSEVLMSAITHPDMVRIARTHGLRVLPVDLDPETLAPRLDMLEEAVTRRTRMLVVAHLFGTRIDLPPIARFARLHNLLLVEDCAQGFASPSETGDPHADVSLYSFGSIKTATALGGALARVRDPEIRTSMSRLQDGYPVQPRRTFARKALATLALSALGRPALYGLAFRFWRHRGRSFDELLEHVVRGFAALRDEEFYRRIREQPSAPLLALLARRLRTFDDARLARRARLGEALAASLAPELTHPGSLAPVRTHWLFPVAAADPPALIATLRAAGFDATPATTSICVVPTPRERPELEPVAATRLMRQVVFVPAYPELRERDRQRLCALLASPVSAAAARPRVVAA